MPIVEEWKQSCSCKTTSSGPRMYHRREYGEGTITVVCGVSAGPVCDRCDTPWRKIKRLEFDNGQSRASVK